MMARICTAPDITTALQAEAADLSGISVIEHTSQPEDFSPKFGWDFMAPESARQFHIQVDEDCALITLDIDGDILAFDVPAHTRATAHLVNAMAMVVSAVASASKTRIIRQAQDRGEEDLSSAVISLISK